MLEIWVTDHQVVRMLIFSLEQISSCFSLLAQNDVAFKCIFIKSASSAYLRPFDRVPFLNMLISQLAATFKIF